jgi:protein SCO1/2
MKRVLGLLLVLGVALAALGFGLWTARALLAPPGVVLEAGTLLPQPRPLGAFALTDTEGGAFTPESLRGRWTMLAFGYASCPDVCPLTMATFRDLRARLAASGHADTVRFVLVSVDPERDALPALKEYVRYFDPAFRGATGPHAALQQLTSQLGVVYRRADAGSALGYLVDHSATLVLLDPQARLAAIFGAPHDPAAIARDLAALAGRPAR